MEIHSEARIERVYRCTWRRYSSVCKDTLGGGNRASLEMQLEAVIKRGCRYTSEAVREQDWTSTWRRSMDGVPGGKTSFIS